MIRIRLVMLIGLYGNIYVSLYMCFVRIVQIISPIIVIIKPFTCYTPMYSILLVMSMYIYDLITS